MAKTRDHSRQTRSHTLSDWDLPTRLFHWLLAASVIAGWYFGEYRTFTTVEWHFYLGYFTACLLAFRLFWGFYGPPNTRFTNVIPTRPAFFAYITTVLKRQPSDFKGHNPLGGLSVFALLMVLSIQVIAGFYAEDDGLFASGPLVPFTDDHWVLLANEVHHITSRIIFILVVLHLCAIIFYWIWKRENLVISMITGRK